MRGTTIRGRVAFVEYDGRVFKLLGLAVEASWRTHVGAITSTLNSFSRVTDRRVLDVAPQRLRLARASRAESLQAFAERHDATVPVKTLAIVNGVWANQSVQAGRTYKLVQGGKLP